MKILYTATVLSHICQFHLPHIRRLKELGHEVHVAAHDNLAVKNGLKLRYADHFWEIPFHRSPASADNLRAFRALKGLLDRESYDLILCNTPMGGIVTRLAAAPHRKRGTRVLYMAHGFHFYQEGLGGLLSHRKAHGQALRPDHHHQRGGLRPGEGAPERPRVPHPGRGRQPGALPSR